MVRKLKAISRAELLFRMCYIGVAVWLLQGNGFATSYNVETAQLLLYNISAIRVFLKMFIRTGNQTCVKKFHTTSPKKSTYMQTFQQLRLLAMRVIGTKDGSKRLFPSESKEQP